MLSLLSVAAAFFTVGSQALPTSQYTPYAPAGGSFKRAISSTTTNSTNSASNRAAWDGTHDINTDWYTTWPTTGVVREVKSS